LSTLIIEGDYTNMWTNEEKKNLPPSYGCQLILSNVSKEAANDPSLPLDAYNVTYYDSEKNLCLDVCRGSRVRIFDLYYDKFGPGSVQKIDWGYGKVNPKLWGISEKKESKKRR
jgi:hypothetical protein